MVTRPPEKSLSSVPLPPKRTTVPGLLREAGRPFVLVVTSGGTASRRNAQSRYSPLNQKCPRSAQPGGQHSQQGSQHGSQQTGPHGSQQTGPQASPQLLPQSHMPP